jgi:hypothetical protein
LAASEFGLILAESSWPEALAKYAQDFDVPTHIRQMLGSIPGNIIII